MNLSKTNEELDTIHIIVLRMERPVTKKAKDWKFVTSTLV